MLYYGIIQILISLNIEKLEFMSKFNDYNMKLGIIVNQVQHSKLLIHIEYDI